MKFINELKRRNVIRVAAAYLIIGWLLAQVSTTLEAALILPPWFDTLIVTVMLIGFPIALIISWVYELTPEGIKKEKDTKTDESINHEASKKLNYITLVAAIDVAGMFILQQMSPKQGDSRLRGNDEVVDGSGNSNQKSVIPAKAEPEIKANSIAVLPFTDLSQNGDQEYFSDGMAEEILNVLVRVSALQVTSRTSAFRYKNSDLRIPEIAEELKVRHVLEGSVRKSGNTLRITAQLIDASNDKHLWSEAYDRPLTAENIFAIQDEISNAIVLALSSSLQLDFDENIAVNKTTDNLTAYELYLKARSLFQSRDQLDRADALLIQAIELDAEFAPAWAMRAAIQPLLRVYGYSDISVEESDQQGLKFANQSITIDPETALGYAVKSLIHMNANIESRGRFDYAEIIAGYKKAQALEPHNATTLNWLAQAYQFLGYLELANETFKLCIHNEPRYFACVGNYIYLNQDLGNDAVALQTYQKSIGQGISFSGNAPLRVFSDLDLELPFLMAVNSKELFYGWHRNHELFQAYKNPQLDHSELIKDALIYIQNKASDRNWAWAEVLVPLGFYGQIDGPLLYRFGQSQGLYKSDVFKQRTKKSGIFDYWQQHGFPPQCSPIGEDDFECE